MRLVVPIDAHLQPPASKQQLMQQQGARERGTKMQHPATSWKEPTWKKKSRLLLLGCYRGCASDTGGAVQPDTE